MPASTKDHIIKKATHLFALNGYEGFSMRTLADECGVGLSSLYHFFSDKDAILKAIFDRITKRLGKERALLRDDLSATEMLKDRVRFQFEHIEEVVFVLKYYLHFRNDYEKGEFGYLPPKAHLHIDEVVAKGVASGEFSISPDETNEESKVVAHAINGFLLEYYPKVPTANELEEIITSIHRFIVRSLTNKEAFV
jgi:AcrR family transcriptional regulator